MDIDKKIYSAFLPSYPFDKFLALQERLAALRSRREIPQVLLFATHPPCFSVGLAEWSCPGKNFKIPLKNRNGILTAEELQVHKARRGGAVTYHGPGILGCYTIFAHLELAVPDYFRLYQFMVKRALLQYRLEATMRLGLPDLWIGRNKIVSIGICHPLLSLHATTFGFNLNVSCDLAPFSSIYPCGERDETWGVTSLERETKTAHSTREVATLLAQSITPFLGFPVLEEEDHAEHYLLLTN